MQVTVNTKPPVVLGLGRRSRNESRGKRSSATRWMGPLETPLSDSFVPEERFSQGSHLVMLQFRHTYAFT